MDGTKGTVGVREGERGGQGGFSLLPTRGKSGREFASLQGGISKQVRERFPNRWGGISK
jgi:hypothetical protein